MTNLAKQYAARYDTAKQLEFPLPPKGVEVDKQKCLDFWTACHDVWIGKSKNVPVPPWGKPRLKRMGVLI